MNSKFRSLQLAVRGGVKHQMEKCGLAWEEEACLEAGGTQRQLCSEAEADVMSPSL